MSAELREEIEKDLQAASEGRRVIVYLEGKTDVPILLGLLGTSGDRETPRGVLHEGVLICGLTKKSGSSAVKRRLEVAREAKISGIFGVLDGDGDGLAQLAGEFDAPHVGPRFRWKGYCIENLLARAAWPGAWGERPDWGHELVRFAPYVAINRLGLDLRLRLKNLGLDRFINPGRAQLRTPEEFAQVLRAGKDELAGLEVDAMFSRELDAFLRTLQVSVDEAHALVNGKWLIDHFAARCAPATQERCRDEWTACLRAAGGDPEIRAWWRRAVAP